jgi:hypothetical protein
VCSKKKEYFFAETWFSPPLLTGTKNTANPLMLSTLEEKIVNGRALSSDFPSHPLMGQFLGPSQVRCGIPVFIRCRLHAQRPLAHLQNTLWHMRTVVLQRENGMLHVQRLILQSEIGSLHVQRLKM